MTKQDLQRPQPLLRKAFPPNGLSARENALLATLDQIIETEIAPQAAAHDEKGRYPTSAVAALKRSGVLKTAVPAAYGGPGFSTRFSLEAQVRLSIADSAVAQIFKIHDELVHEAFVYSTADFRPALAKKLLDENAILGLAVAESGRKVDDPLTTIAMPQAGGGFVVNGQKIYTTGAAEADYIVTWAFNPQAHGVADNPLLGAQALLVPANTAGVTIHRDWDALGQRATDSGTVTFKDLKTAPDWTCSLPGKGPLPDASLRYQAGFAAVLVGLGIGALRAAIPFVTSKSRPWPSAAVDNAADDPFVRRLVGEFTAAIAGLCRQGRGLACGRARHLRDFRLDGHAVGRPRQWLRPFLAQRPHRFAARSGGLEACGTRPACSDRVGSAARDLPVSLTRAPTCSAAHRGSSGLDW
jgi:alkylation response protein AidB-like acyl-CoA dehydrogenase